MAVFKVGDVVEVVKTYRFHDWLGRQLIVVGFGPRTDWERVGLDDSVITCPSPDDDTPGWAPFQLRKIDPPDWTAPHLTDETLDA